MILEYTTSLEHGYLVLLQFLKQECLSVVTRKAVNRETRIMYLYYGWMMLTAVCEMPIA